MSIFTTVDYKSLTDDELLAIEPDQRLIDPYDRVSHWEEVMRRELDGAYRHRYSAPDEDGYDPMYDECQLCGRLISRCACGPEGYFRGLRIEELLNFCPRDFDGATDDEINRHWAEIEHRGLVDIYCAKYPVSSPQHLEKLDRHGLANAG